MKDKIYSFILIYNWMITRIDLSGNELLTFAIIYGYSRDKSSEFKGSNGYLAETIGCSRQSVINTLKSLVAKKLLIKTTRLESGMDLYSYKVNSDIINRYDGSDINENEPQDQPLKSLHPVKKVYTPCKEILHSNKEDNIDTYNNIYNIYSSTVANAPDDELQQITIPCGDDQLNNSHSCHAEVSQSNNVALPKKKIKKPRLELDEKTKEDFMSRWNLYPDVNINGNLFRINNRERKIIASIPYDEIVRVIDRYKQEVAAKPWREYRNADAFFRTDYKKYLDAEWGKNHPQESSPSTAADSVYDANGYRTVSF